MAKAYHVTSLEVCASGMERLRSNSEWILAASASGPDIAEVISGLRAESTYLPEAWDCEAAMVALETWLAEGGREALEAELAAVPWDEWTPDGPEAETADSLPVLVYIRETQEESGNAN